MNGTYPREQLDDDIKTCEYQIKVTQAVHDNMPSEETRSQLAVLQKRYAELMDWVSICNDKDIELGMEA